MIEIFRMEGKWRIKIVNETLEFNTTKEFEEVFKQLIKLKEKQEPYKYPVANTEIFKQKIKGVIKSKNG